MLENVKAVFEQFQESTTVQSPVHHAACRTPGRSSLYMYGVLKKKRKKERKEKKKKET